MLLIIISAIHLLPCLSYKFLYPFSEIKNERNCNASYIFAAVSAFETAFAVEINLGTVINFSEQWLVSSLDFDTCDGNTVKSALDFLVSNGTYYEPVYPYFGQKISLLPKNYPVHQLNHYERLKISSKEEFIAANTIKPLIVKISYSSQDSFLKYTSGNYVCSSTVEGTHYMLAASDGFSASTGTILLKNNWGLGWGEKGLMRLNLNSTMPLGPCNIYEEVYSVSFTTALC